MNQLKLGPRRKHTNKIRQASTRYETIAFVLVTALTPYAFPAPAAQALETSSAGASLSTGSQQKLFRQAKTAYFAGDLDKAQRLYDRLLEAFPRSVSLAYNLALVCAKRGELGRARALLLRAARWGGGADVDKARTRVDAKLLEKRSRPSEKAPPLLFNAWIDLPTPWTSLIVAFVFNVIACLSLLLAFKSVPGTRRIASGVTCAMAGSLAVVFFVLLALKTNAFLPGQPAITQSENATLREGPDTRASIVTTLDEGDLLYVTATRASHAQVKLPSGKTGWVPRNEIENIND